MHDGARRRADLALLALSAIWGLTFPLIRSALADVDAFRFLGARFGAAVVAFAPLALLSGRARAGLRRALPVGLALGALAFVSYFTQTMGLRTVPAGRAAFITGTNVILVPLLSPLFRAGRPGVIDLAGAVVATAGLFFLTDPSGTGIGPGDLWVLACALAYALYIHALQKVLRRGHDELALAFTQVLGLALLAQAGLPFASGDPVWSAPVWIAVGFTALFATVGSFWIQTRYQGRTTPERAALLFAMEPVFAAVFAALLLSEHPRPHEIVGSLLVLVAVLGVELVPRRAPVPAAPGAPEGHGSERPH